MQQNSEEMKGSCRVGTWSIDIATDKMDADVCMAELYGLSAEIIAAPFPMTVLTGAIHPDDRAKFLDTLSQAISVGGGNVFTAEHRVGGADGTRELLVRGRIDRDARGAATRISGVSIDVTQQRSAERTFTETRRRLDAALVAGEIGTWLYDVKNDRVKADANLLKIFGISLPAEEMEDGVSLALFADKVHPDDQAPAIEKMGQCLAEGSTYEIAYRILSEEGDRSVIARGSVDRDAKGLPVRMSGVVLDVTEREHAEAARIRLDRQLNEQARTFDAVLNSISDPAYIISLDGRFQFANRSLLELWGLTASEASGKTFAELHYDPMLIERLMRDIHKVLETGAVVRGEDHYVSSTGEERFFEHVFSPIFDDAGVVTAIAGCSRDITERQKLQEGLRQLAADLSEANRRKDEFLATLAHELRNPLAPLRNGLEVMKLSVNNPKALEESRGMMERQLSQMVRLIDDLLDVNRISRGKIPLRKSRVPLADVVRQAVETSRPLLEHARHHLTISIPPEPIFIEADPTRIAQVFSNLLNNAAKYSDREGHVWLTVERQGSWALVTIRDTGVGIPPEMIPRIFEMFTQVNSSLDRSQGGLGIGLSLAKGLIEMHGGDIEAKSAGTGRGSEFVVRLPTVPAPEFAAVSAIAARHISSPRRKILVVDDNRDSATSMAKLLNIMGNETYVAHDGAEALKAAAEFKPQVILLDIGMPNLNGYEAAKRIRREAWGRDVVLMAMTGWGQEDDKRRSKEAGFDHHLVKPVDLQKLEALLARPA
jgi:PAS domain S-box-containing protein